MLINFFGKECPHCETMEPLIKQVEKELGVVVDRREVWHDSENMKLLSSYDKGLCGGVPFLYNTESKDYICGEAGLEEIKIWAQGK